MNNLAVTIETALSITVLSFPLNLVRNMIGLSKIGPIECRLKLEINYTNILGVP